MVDESLIRFKLDVTEKSNFKRNEITNSDDQIAKKIDYTNNLLNYTNIDIKKSKNLIYDPNYHSIPIFIHKSKNERKYKRISNQKNPKIKSEKVKFFNIHSQESRPNPCSNYFLASKSNHFTINHRNLIGDNIKHLSETDTDDYLSYCNHSYNQRQKRAKKSLNHRTRETSFYQTNRLSEFTPCQLGLNVCNTSSFINSPIHLLMNCQKPSKEESLNFPFNEQIPEEINYEPLDFNFSLKYMFSLAFVSFLVLTLINFYETMINLFKVNITSLIVSKLSFGLIGLLVVIWFAILNAKLCKNIYAHRKYYNLFESEKTDLKEEEEEANLSKESENSDRSLNQRENLIVRSSSQLNKIKNYENFNLNWLKTNKIRRKNEILIYNPKLKFRFFLFIFGILIINLSILVSFIYSYLSNADNNNTFTSNQQIVESALSTLGSVGLILFIYNLCINLLEMSYKNNSNHNGIIVCQIDIDDKKYDSRDLFKKQHNQVIKKMEKIAVKFFAFFKLSFVLVSASFYYLDCMTIRNSLNKILNKVCIDSLRNDQILTCPNFLAKNKFFDWLNELEQRRIHVYLKAKLFENHYQLRVNQSLDKEVSKSFTPIEDLYLMLISLCILIFFICISISFACIKKSLNQNSNQHRYFDENVTYSDRQNSSIKRKVFILHLTVLLVLYQGFIKTIFFNEIIKVTLSNL